MSCPNQGLQRVAFLIVRISFDGQYCSQSSHSVLRILTLVVFLALQEPDPLFKVCVDELVEELHIQKLSEPHLIEKK